VDDLKARITVSLVSSRILNLFESGDLQFNLDQASFTQDCADNGDVSYTIQPDGGLTDYQGPAGCLCDKSSTVCSVCAPFTDLTNGKCQCTFEYDFQIDTDGNNATLSVQNVELTEDLFNDCASIGCNDIFNVPTFNVSSKSAKKKLQQAWNNLECSVYYTAYSQAVIDQDCTKIA
jgi:hypothetical protein